MVNPSTCLPAGRLRSGLIKTRNRTKINSQKNRSIEPKSESKNKEPKNLITNELNNLELRNRFRDKFFI
jgi:hypothetical protein